MRAGFTVLRFVADNVGYWLFHCHMSWHNHLGMGLVIKVFLSFLKNKPENFLCIELFHLVNIPTF